MTRTAASAEIWQYTAIIFQFIHEYREEIIAIGTVILAFATGFLWFATRSLAKSAERTTQKQLRAYVSLESGGVDKTSVDGQPGVVIRVDLKNYGTTPGYDFRAWMNVPTVLDNAAVPFTGPSTSLADRSASILGPGSLAHMQTAAAFPRGAVDLEEIRNGTKTIFVWGGADYVDAFGHPRHFTFRCAINGREDAGQSWGLRPHKVGYEAN